MVRLLMILTVLIGMSAHGREPLPIDVATVARTVPPTVPTLTEVSSVDSATVNPFKPAAPARRPEPESPPPPPPPPMPPAELAAMEERQRFHTEGRYIGLIAGQAIYRHNGRYLIESTSEAKSGKKPTPENASCVVRIVAKGVGHDGNRPTAAPADIAKEINARESPQ